MTAVVTGLLLQPANECSWLASQFDERFLEAEGRLQLGSIIPRSRTILSIPPSPQVHVANLEISKNVWLLMGSTSGVKLNGTM